MDQINFMFSECLRCFGVFFAPNDFPREISKDEALQPYSFYYFQYFNKQGQEVSESMENHSLTYWGNNHLCFKVDALNNLLVNSPWKINGHDLLFNFNITLLASLNIIDSPSQTFTFSFDLTGSRIPPDFNSSGNTNMIYQFSLLLELLLAELTGALPNFFSQDMFVQVIYRVFKN